MHMIPFSKTDVQWKKTIDQTFSGTNTKAGNANVKEIFNGVLQALAENSGRHFTVSEVKYFSMWYNRLHEQDKCTVKTLVKDGKIEFANGGWASPDEALPNYNDLILNMQKGHDFLMKEFNFTPRIGW